MTAVGRAKTAAIAIAGGLGLTAGALLFGAPLVSAEDPPATPSAAEESGDTQGAGTGVRTPGECDGDKTDANGASTGVGLRGGSRSLRQ
jgi:hypothetical protein